MLLNLDPTLIDCREPATGATLLHTTIKAFRTHSSLEVLPPQERLEEVLEFLLTKIDVNITDNNGATPLHYYCFYVSYEVSSYLWNERSLMMLLKQPNINVNATMTYNRFGSEIGFHDPIEPLGLMTPLHICCDIDTKNSNRIAMLLLQRSDVDLHPVNEDGQTPMDIAKAGEKIWKRWGRKGNSILGRYHEPTPNFVQVFLLEEAEFIRNFNNLANLFE